MFSTCVIKVPSLRVPHSPCVKRGSFQLLLLNSRHAKHELHLCLFFLGTVVVVVEKGFGGSLAMLFASQNCLWATFVHHHNVELIKKKNKHFGGTLCVYVYIYTPMYLP